jgi:PAS domain S-box-containing protein
MAKLVLNFSTANGNITVFWIPGGLALAALLTWGWRFWPAVFLGAFAAGIMVKDPASVSLFLATGNTLETVTATWLIRRLKINLELAQLSDFFHLAFVAVFCTLISALIGPLTLLMAGYLNWQNVSNNILHWWQADIIGILLSTPLFLIWQKFPHHWFARKNFVETIALIGLCILTGQFIFLGWFNSIVIDFARGYWLFLIVVWAAIRRGQHGASLVICITAIQALLGATQGVGIFAHDITNTGLQNFWFYILTLTLVGISLATFVESKMKAEVSLRNERTKLRVIFNLIPDLVWFKDLYGVYSSCNKRFESFFGKSEAEIIGKTDYDFVNKDLADYFRKNDLLALNYGGKVINEEWITFASDGHQELLETTKTPLMDMNGKYIGVLGIGHDITYRKQAEEERLAHEVALRKTLVREVHHRIKNSLQGAVGLLRQSIKQHPELQESITKVISEIRSIAVTHGLQGINQHSQVILQELVTEISASNLSLWNSHLVANIQSNLPVYKITEVDAVPIALILNELLLNAIKHSPKNTEVHIELRADNAQNALLTISNVGQISQSANTPHTPEMGTGLTLIDFLLPKHGASLSWEQSSELVLTRLMLTSPVITLVSTEIQS